MEIIISTLSWRLKTAMAGLLISNPSSFTLPLPSPPPTQQPSIKPPHSVFFPVVRFSGDPICRKTRGRGLTVVTRAGPGTSSYIFAFVLPLSLLAITVFTSIRIADKLDEDFLEEVNWTCPGWGFCVLCVLSAYK